MIDRKVQEALNRDDISSAIDWLKKGIRKDAKWTEGHRLLGDIYLTLIDHPRYALLEYRKLNHLVDDNQLDQLRLAMANKAEGFTERVRELVEQLDTDDFPETMELVRETVDPDKRFQQLRETLTEPSTQRREELFEKHRENGNVYRTSGQYKRAQTEYDKALNHKHDFGVRLDKARCLIHRSCFPEAIQELKKVLSDSPNAREARQLLIDVYRRLGLPEGSIQERYERMLDESERATGS